MKKNLLLSFFSILSVFCLVELYLRFANYHPWIRTEPGQYSNRAATDLAWPDAHPELGWVLNRNRPVPHKDKRNNIDLVYVGNEEGFRDYQKWRSFTDVSVNNNNIMVFGDSMVFGFGVEENKRISNQLEILTNSKYGVYNLAIPGWGFDQMFLAFRKYAPLFKPKIAVFVYINDDLFRSLESYREVKGLNKPSFEVRNGALELRKYENKRTIRSILKNFVLKKIYTINLFYRYFYRAYQAKILNAEIVNEIINIAQKYNTRLIFVHIPDKTEIFSSSYWKQRLIWIKTNIFNRFFGLNSVLQQNQKIFIEAVVAMKKKGVAGKVNYYFPYAHHINENGHLLIAELLAKKLDEAELVWGKNHR